MPFYHLQIVRWHTKTCDFWRSFSKCSSWVIWWCCPQVSLWVFINGPSMYSCVSDWLHIFWRPKQLSFLVLSIRNNNCLCLSWCCQSEITTAFSVALHDGLSRVVDLAGSYWLGVCRTDFRLHPSHHVMEEKQENVFLIVICHEWCQKGFVWNINLVHFVQSFCNMSTLCKLKVLQAQVTSWSAGQETWIKKTLCLLYVSSDKKVSQQPVWDVKLAIATWFKW